MTAILVNPPAVDEPAGRSFIAGQKTRLKPSQYYSLPIEHLGIMSIAAYARTRGISVATINGMVEGHASVEETWHAVKTAALGQGTPTLIGFTNIDTFDDVVWLAERCRQEWDQARIVIGNTFATLNHERVLRDHDCFDFVIVGDGEVGFAALAEALCDNRSTDAVPGLAWRRADGTIATNAPAVVDLDELPWPARDELPTVLGEGFSGAVFTTRGCLYRCTFCGTGAVSDLLGRNRYRARSIGNVVDEIEYLQKDFGVDFVCISDDLFLAKHPSAQQRAADLADEILRRQLHIDFMFDARIDALADLALLDHLRRAGLRRVFVGLETGSFEQLVAYRKRHVGRGQDPAVRINALQELGIEIIPGTIMFHPAVRPAELRETLRLLDATGYRTPRKLLDRITAYPGTPLHAEYTAKGYLTLDWPIGEWEFLDPCARDLYRQVSEHINGNTDITFDDAADFFLARVADWERAMQDVEGRSSAGLPRRSLDIQPSGA